MKKKEKEHLKDDPFIRFFEKAFTLFRSHRRRILMAAGVAVLAVLLLLAVMQVRRLSVAGENRLYAEAFRVRTSDTLSLEQKIAALEKMKFKNGVSAAGRLFLAALYFQKGDLAKAGSVLETMPASRVALLNDEKHVLHARVLEAGGKLAEAEGVLQRLLDGGKTAMARETILLQLAALQTKGKRNAEAAATLKRIQSEFPDTPSAMEARNLLDSLPHDAEPPR
ncbi:MAG: hypothetical protein JXO51_04975 [Candidatus Aminicenantes bacterium]|nr:hypothetical protein [Candidatus Aminicenantes bacterium]